MPITILSEFRKEIKKIAQAYTEKKNINCSINIQREKLTNEPKYQIIQYREKGAIRRKTTLTMYFLNDKPTFNLQNTRHKIDPIISIIA